MEFENTFWKESPKGMTDEEISGLKRWRLSGNLTGVETLDSAFKPLYLFRWAWN